jgi:hypothetical protein
MGMVLNLHACIARGDSGDFCKMVEMSRNRYFGGIETKAPPLAGPGSLIYDDTMAVGNVRRSS